MSVDKIKEYGRRLEKHSENKAVLKETLHKLDKMDVTVDILQETGIGKIVNSIKKKGGSTGTLANDLIRKWRNVVDQEAEEEPPSVPNESHHERTSGNREEHRSADRHDKKHSSSHRSKSEKESKSKSDKHEKSHSSSKPSNSDHKTERNGHSSKPHSSGHSKTESKPSSSHKSQKSTDKPEAKPAKETDRKDRKRPRSPEKDEQEGLDANFGTFEDCLGLNDPKIGKKKKKLPKTSSSPKMTVTTSTLNSSIAKPKGPRLPDLPDKRALDAEIPSLVTEYKPLPRVELKQQAAPKMPLINPEEMFSSNKRDRTAVYSGRRNYAPTEVPTLFDSCIRVLIDHVDYIEQTGGVPYDILKPILLRCTWEQLYNLEHYNPYLVEESDPLWEKHVRRDFRGKEPKRGEETWRELYLQLHDDRENKLKSLAATISKSHKEKLAPVRQTKLAYVDSVAKAPRYAQRAQLRNGQPSNACRPDPSRARLIAANASTASATESVRARAVAVPKKPKQAPLMMKAMSFIKQRKGYGFSSQTR